MFVYYKNFRSLTIPLLLVCLRIQVIILSARFKLAVELEKAIQQLGRHKNVRAHAMSAGSPWMQGTQILIGVPNFLLEKMRSGTVNVSNAHVIIVDDAEEMDRFSGSINELINFTSANINQVCFLGSTIPSSLVAHARDFDVHIDDISVVEKHVSCEYTCLEFYTHWLTLVVIIHSLSLFFSWSLRRTLNITNMMWKMMLRRWRGCVKSWWLTTTQSSFAIANQQYVLSLSLAKKNKFLNVSLFSLSFSIGEVSTFCVGTPWSCVCYDGWGASP